MVSSSFSSSFFSSTFEAGPNSNIFLRKNEIYMFWRKFLKIFPISIFFNFLLLFHSTSV
jgi:hypothetical protein